MEQVNAEWIRRKLEGSKRGEQKKLADFVGIEPEKLSKILSDDRRVQAAEVSKFIEYFAQQSEVTPTRVEPGEIAPPDTDLISVFDVSASAGHGALVGDYEAIAYTLAFPPDYLRRVTRANPSNLAIISVKGDSMEPTLKDDDIVMIDTSKTSLGYDGLFVLRFDDALHVKRISRSAPGFVTIISDNKTNYPTREFAVEDVTVIGKVLWKGGKV